MTISAHKRTVDLLHALHLDAVPGVPPVPEGFPELDVVLTISAPLFNLSKFLRDLQVVQADSPQKEVQEIILKTRETIAWGDTGNLDDAYATIGPEGDIWGSVTSLDSLVTELPVLTDHPCSLAYQVWEYSFQVKSVVADIYGEDTDLWPIFPYTGPRPAQATGETSSAQATETDQDRLAWISRYWPIPGVSESAKHVVIEAVTGLRMDALEEQGTRDVPAATLVRALVPGASDQQTEEQPDRHQAPLAASIAQGSGLRDVLNQACPNLYEWIRAHAGQRPINDKPTNQP